MNITNEEEILNYEMKVIVGKDKNEKEYALNCWFLYDKEQYGNGYYVSIEGSDFSPRYLDIRYDRSFNKNDKSKWLEEWAKNYWSGKDGAWIVKEIDIIPINEQ